jgi:hypothetical protein
VSPHDVDTDVDMGKYFELSKPGAIVLVTIDEPHC